jgi:hypothetical protein
MLIPESIEHVAARDATPTIPSTSLEELRRALPEEAADLRLNLQSVLGEGALSPGRRFGVAVAVPIRSAPPSRTPRPSARSTWPRSSATWPRS